MVYHIGHKKSKVFAQFLKNTIFMDSLYLNWGKFRVLTFAPTSFHNILFCTWWRKNKPFAIMQKSILNCVIWTFYELFNQTVQLICVAGIKLSKYHCLHLQYSKHKYIYYIPHWKHWKYFFVFCLGKVSRDLRSHRVELLLNIRNSSNFSCNWSKAT